MHRSRFSTLLIDVPSHRASDAAAFWSAALGMPADPVPGEAQFTSLPGAFPGLVTAIQAVDDEPRYHVDIETDDWRPRPPGSSPWERSSFASEVISANFM